MTVPKYRDKILGVLKQATGNCGTRAAGDKPVRVPVQRGGKGQTKKMAADNSGVMLAESDKVTPGTPTVNQAGTAAPKPVARRQPMPLKTTDVGGGDGLLAKTPSVNSGSVVGKEASANTLFGALVADALFEKEAGLWDTIRGAAGAYGDQFNKMYGKPIRTAANVATAPARGAARVLQAGQGMARRAGDAVGQAAPGVVRGAERAARSMVAPTTLARAPIAFPPAGAQAAGQLAGQVGGAVGGAVRGAARGVGNAGRAYGQEAQRMYGPAVNAYMGQAKKMYGPAAKAYGQEFGRMYGPGGPARQAAGQVGRAATAPSRAVGNAVGRMFPGAVNGLDAMMQKNFSARDFGAAIADQLFDAASGGAARPFDKRAGSCSTPVDRQGWAAGIKQKSSNNANRSAAGRGTRTKMPTLSKTAAEPMGSWLARQPGMTTTTSQGPGGTTTTRTSGFIPPGSPQMAEYQRMQQEKRIAMLKQQLRGQQGGGAQQPAASGGNPFQVMPQQPVARAAPAQQPTPAPARQGGWFNQMGSSITPQTSVQQTPTSRTTTRSFSGRLEPGSEAFNRNQQYMQQVRQRALQARQGMNKAGSNVAFGALAADAAFEKDGGYWSEALSGFNPLNAYGGTLAAGGVALATPTRSLKQQAALDANGGLKQVLMNLLVPGVGPYNAWKRVGTSIRGPELKRMKEEARQRVAADPDRQGTKDDVTDAEPEPGERTGAGNVGTQRGEATTHSPPPEHVLPSSNPEKLPAEQLAVA